MGETAKKVVGYTALAGAAYFTGGAALAMYGGSALTSSAVSTGLLLGLASAGVGTSMLGAAATEEALEFEKEQAKMDMELAKLAGRQDIINIENEKRRIRGIAIAKAASQNKDVFSIRAFLGEVNKRAEDDKRNSLLNAAGRTRSGNLEVARLGSRQRAATMTGITGSVRSLLTAGIQYGRVG
jgi:hypothetical protein